MADYLQLENKRNETPLILALPDIALPVWLCEQGAAHNSKSGILESKRIPEHEHEHVLRFIIRRKARFSAINTLLLQSCVTSLYSTTISDYKARTSWPIKRTPHHLTLFHGFQSVLFKVIANFAVYDDSAIFKTHYIKQRGSCPSICVVLAARKHSTLGLMLVLPLLAA